LKLKNQRAKTKTKEQNRAARGRKLDNDDGQDDNHDDDDGAMYKSVKYVLLSIVTNFSLQSAAAAVYGT